MTRWWARLQRARFRVRVPIKLGLFAGVVFLTLFPYPHVFWRHVRHLRNLSTLTDPFDPALTPVRAEFEAHLQSTGSRPADTGQLRGEIERFVYGRVPYAWDWDNWGVADYLPTVGEVVARGREDWVAPRNGTLAWAGLHLLVAGWLLLYFRPRRVRD